MAFLMILPPLPPDLIGSKNDLYRSNLDNQQQQQQQSSRIHPVANCCIRPNSTDPDTRVVKPLIYLFDKHEKINKGQFNID